VKQLLDWTLERLRTDHAMMNWLEERRYEWVPLAEQTIKRIVSGASVIVLTDPKNRWIAKYLIQTLNDSSKNRPFFPVYDGLSVFPFLDDILKENQFEIAEDMLSLSFHENYIFWYIGTANHPYAAVAKESANSFLWIMDDEIQNSFFLRSADDLLDIKLMHMVRLFDQTLDAVLFGEIEL